MKNIGGKIGFDTDKYLKYQSIKIQKILNKPYDKMYIEMGGKVIQDKHSARVLPGYREDAKLELIKSLCKDSGLIFVVSAKDIVRGRLSGFL